MTVNVTLTDRLYGVNEGLGVKAPCVVASTGANLSLSGLSVIDGILLNAGDRVLVKDQTDLTQNGIYNAATGPWTRAADADGNRDFVRGSRVSITDGTLNGGSVWALTATNPVIVGSSPLPWVILTYSDSPHDGYAYARDNGVWVRVLPLSGGTMTGRLILAGGPQGPNDAVSQQYVNGLTLGGVGDSVWDGQTYGRRNGVWVPTVGLTGATMTGPLTLSQDPTTNMMAATKEYVDARSTAMRGSFVHLTINGGPPYTGSGHQIQIFADLLIVAETNLQSFAELTGVNCICDTTVSGAGGLDTGVVTASTQYFLYVIRNPTTNVVAALCSLTAAVPTLPSGYTQWGRVGAFMTDAAGGGEVFAFRQLGRQQQYRGSILPLLCNGVAGTATDATFAPIAFGWVSKVAPSSASSVRLFVNTYGMAAGSHVYMAPTNIAGAPWTGMTGLSPPPFVYKQPNPVVMSAMQWLLIDGSAIYYASDDSHAAVYALGYDENE